LMKKPIVYDDGCHVNNGETVSPDCTYGVTGSSKKIVLFGDSHAAQWFPALEKIALARGYELISLTKSACPGPAVKKVETGAYKNADCSAWRSNAIARIQKIQPEAVLVSGMQNYEVPKGYVDRATWWREGEVKTLSALKGSSQHIIYIADTPHPDRDIPSCIAAGNISRCNGSEKALQIFSTGYQQINPTPWLCDRECPAVISETVVYRDASHLSVAMARQLSSSMDRALSNLGVFPAS
jgi:SGNH domain (fused to AT3 domains)